MDEARLDQIILAHLREEDSGKTDPTDDEVFAGIEQDLPLDAVPVTELDRLNWTIQQEIELGTFTP